ncbi:uncharacterized protein B0T15DRAFT_166404 [Chaetomium strumarium]|uniref:Uncharacterized protein n=1 Tax=Chaetomium strumarium TaxID=1170767 RepID=A0AAJ0GW36_9PEZI|nr:hypothetical protein B0T15DRAFT_166404 [Chaetomium strumarium]
MRPPLHCPQSATTTSLAFVNDSRGRRDNFATGNQTWSIGFVLRPGATIQPAIFFLVALTTLAVLPASSQMPQLAFMLDSNNTSCLACTQSDATIGLHARRICSGSPFPGGPLLINIPGFVIRDQFAAQLGPGPCSGRLKTGPLFGSSSRRRSRPIPPSNKSSESRAEPTNNPRHSTPVLHVDECPPQQRVSTCGCSPRHCIDKLHRMVLCTGVYRVET